MEAIIVLILFVFVFWLFPTLVIFAVNVLLVSAGATPIIYGVKTWFAMLIIMLILAGIAHSAND